MNREIILTKNAPTAIGPYSQAVRAGPFFFTSGQIPINPETGKVVEGDITVQTRRVLENLKAVLAAAGLTFAHVVKSTIFVRDLSQFPTINMIYAEYFPEDPPGRSTVEVSRLPLDAAIEIELVAYMDR
jgi:2-iminobutanoate/2-iminopropanoate deaminase